MFDHTAFADQSPDVVGRTFWILFNNFFNTLGLDYVSCSPYRVPTAILAAAQAVIQEDS